MISIPSSRYTFGVLIREAQLLTLANTEERDYTGTEQFQVRFSNSGLIGTTVALSELEQTMDQPIPLLRIAVGRFLIVGNKLEVGIGS